MKMPMQITFHDLSHSSDIESKIFEVGEKLDRFYPEIISCRVVVDLANRRHKKGNLYRIHIDVSVPGTELYVGREPGDRNTHKDVFVAIRDAFNAMERQLQEYAKERRGGVKRGVNGFDKLEREAEVRFAEEAGLEGPQASTVEGLERETKHDSTSHNNVPLPGE